MSNLGPLILAIDTTSRRGSLALARDGRIVALLGIESDAPQSAVLWSDVDMILKRCGASVHDVAAFAVARGPGGFTGLRVGMAAAAGFARATGRPLYGATSLEATARASGAVGRVWAVLNAYRREVYGQPFEVGADGLVAPLAEPVVAPPADLFAAFEAAPLAVVGSGADAYADLLAEAAASRGEPLVRAGERGGWRHLPPPAFLAGEIALMAGEWAAAGREPGPVEPCYVRASEAEINLRLGRLERTGVGDGRCDSR